MYTFRKFFLHSPGHYVGALLIAAAVTAFRMFMLPEGVGELFAWYDSLSVAGGVTFFTGALVTVSYFGAFNLFGYVFSPGRLGEHRKYKSYAHYCQLQEESRARLPYYFIPYYVVGIAVLLVSFLVGGKPQLI